MFILANVSLRSQRLFYLKSLNEEKSENHLLAEQRVVDALWCGLVRPGRDWCFNVTCSLNWHSCKIEIKNPLFLHLLFSKSLCRYHLFVGVFLPLWISKFQPWLAKLVLQWDGRKTPQEKGLLWNTTAKSVSVEPNLWNFVLVLGFEVSISPMQYVTEKKGSVSGFFQKSATRFL